jgi:hypothetical protein
VLVVGSCAGPGSGDLAQAPEGRLETASSRPPASALPALVNLMVTQLTKLGPLPMSIGGGVGVFVETSSGKPDWRVRVVAAILLLHK